MNANWEDSVRRDHVKSKLKVSSAMCQGKRLEKERKTLKFREQRSVQYTSTSPCLREVAIFFPNLYRPVFSFRVALRELFKSTLETESCWRETGGGGGGGLGKMSTS